MTVCDSVPHLSMAVLERGACLLAKVSICLQPCEEYPLVAFVCTGPHAGLLGARQHRLCWWELYLQTAAVAIKGIMGLRIAALHLIKRSRCKHHILFPNSHSFWVRPQHTGTSSHGFIETCQ